MIPKRRFLSIYMWLWSGTSISVCGPCFVLVYYSTTKCSFSFRYEELSTLRKNIGKRIFNVAKLMKDQPKKFHHRIRLKKMTTVYSLIKIKYIEMLISYIFRSNTISILSIKYWYYTRYSIIRSKKSELEIWCLQISSFQRNFSWQHQLIYFRLCKC
jgi:hypothetical protein